jgi:hypothetical protein
MVSLPPRPNTRMSEVLATVDGPPATGTAPPFTRMFPAASRLTAIALLKLSPVTVSTPEAKPAVVAALAGTAVTAVMPMASTTPASNLRNPFMSFSFREETLSRVVRSWGKFIAAGPPRSPRRRGRTGRR